MPYLIGIVLALVVAIFARLSGFDRDRSFYSTEIGRASCRERVYVLV